MLTNAPKINNTELVKAFTDAGGKLYHFRPVGERRGITFAYQRKGRRVTFSTAVQHSADTFTKKIGTKTAIEHFIEGRVVTLPLKSSQTNVVNALDVIASVIQY